jgi:DNA-binding MarR family transcriptional regulator
MANNDGIIDGIVENLFQVLPLIHRKLTKIDLDSVDKLISRPHFIVMRAIDQLGPLPVSQIGEKLLIARPQMTGLIERLVELEMVERTPDKNDRRIINVTLTARGKVTLEACGKLIKNNIIEKLARLQTKDLEELSAALQKIRDIGLKLE